MSLAGEVAHPVKYHVDVLGYFLLHIFLVYTTGALIVCLYWIRRLWVAHLFEVNPDGIGIWPPISSSVADAITLVMMVDRTWIALLTGGMGSAGVGALVGYLVLMLR